jgi:hypothetical protein
MMEAKKQRCSLVLVTTAVAFLTAKTVGAQFGDIDAFSGYVPPNVVVLLDSSDSMNHHLWDDDFDPEKLYPRSSTRVIAVGPQRLRFLELLVRATGTPEISAPTTTTSKAQTALTYCTEAPSRPIPSAASRERSIMIRPRRRRPGIL